MPTNPSAITQIDEATARSRISTARAVDLIMEAFKAYGRDEAVLSAPSAMLMDAGSGRATFKVKGAVRKDMDLAGFRLIADIGDGGTDYHVVMKATSGEIVGFVDERWLHCVRTAVTGVVAAHWLAPPKVRTVALLGSGKIASEAIPALRHLIKPDRVIVTSRRPERAQAFAERHGTAEMPVTTAATVPEACADADVIIAITDAGSPILHGSDLPPGVTVCGLGGRHELDISVLEASKTFILDDPDFAAVAGSVSGWIGTGAMARAAVDGRMAGTIGDVALGRTGRAAPGDTVLVIIQGMALCDLTLAAAALEMDQ